MSTSRGKDGAAATPLDRRQFLGVAGAGAATVLVPWPAAAAMPAASAAAPARGVGAARHGAGEHADDVWGVYPRYAEPIGFARPRAEPARLVDPLDAV